MPILERNGKHFYEPLNMYLHVYMHVVELLDSPMLLCVQRSDYLHRMLYEELSDYPNVYFPTWRMATIWGGASLLQMILSTMADLEYILTDWHWDYLINLSESDFPVRFVGRSLCVSGWL